MPSSAILLSLFLLLPLSIPAFAGEGRVEEASAQPMGLGWRIEVSVRHEDTGWEHFIDYWIVETQTGQEIGRRKLLHPHIHEQPFTRSLSSLNVPDGLRKVYIRLHCKRDGLSKTRYMVKLRN